MEIRLGRFDSVTIAIVREEDPTLLELAIRGRTESPKGAVYIEIPEKLLSLYLDILLYFRCKFHHYLNGAYTYYIWNVKDDSGNPIEDKVPAYATSIEGVGALILSPDLTKVLLVWEYGKWKMVTGAMKAGESPVATLRREIQEEVGLEIMDDVCRVGGWHISRSRFNEINDNFTAFVVVAKSEKFTVDNVEIKDARWFNCNELLLRIDISKIPENDPTSASVDGPANAGASCGEFSAPKGLDTKFSWIALRFLSRYRQSQNVYTVLSNVPYVDPTGKYTLYI